MNHLPSKQVYKMFNKYLEKLKHRNYMLPSYGIEATYHNAGDILRIFFQVQPVG